MAGVIQLLMKIYGNKNMFLMSHSSMELFKKDKKAWVRKYVYGEEQPSNVWMNFGKRFAEAMEFRENEHDADIQNLKFLIPDYQNREYRVEHKEAGRGFIGILDGYSEKLIGEYKTGKHWDQNLVDQSSQLTYYAWLIFKREGFVPDIELTWVETVTNGRKVSFSGNVKTFKTSRSIGQLDLMEKIAFRLYDQMIITMRDEVEKI